MNTQQMPQRFLPFMGVLLLAACGSDTTAPDGGRPAVSVSVVPTTASLLTSGSQDFTATVTNDPTNRGVAWSITGCSGGPAVCGEFHLARTRIYRCDPRHDCNRHDAEHVSHRLPLEPAASGTLS